MLHIKSLVFIVINQDKILSKIDLKISLFISSVQSRKRLSTVFFCFLFYNNHLENWTSIQLKLSLEANFVFEKAK